MNLVLLHPEDFMFGESHATLTGRRLEYVREIQRAEVGQTLCVGLVNGPIGEGRVVSLSTRSLELDVTLDRVPPQPLPLTLILALPRPLVLKRTLLTACSLGIKRIVLLNANRVEKSFWQSTALEPSAIEAQLVLGLEQARDTRMPEVLLRPRFRPFVEDELDGLAAADLRLVAHPGAPAACPRAVERPVTLAVGPEGGWNDHEIERLAATGFESIALGERVLRVETAVTALVSRLF